MSDNGATSATRATSWTRWADGAVRADALFTFRRVFGGIWLVYDLMDIAFKGTAWGRDWLGPVPAGLVLFQLICVVCEVAMVADVGASAACAVAGVVRLLMAFGFFRLNDFYFVGVACLLLAILPRRRGDSSPLAPCWLVDVLRWQTAWIYAATALLKVNKVFLSGEHLYVRHAYLAEVWGWPYPDFVRALLERKGVNAILAVLTVVAEGSIAALLLAPPRIRRFALFVAIAVHGFAAVFVNVWFFGAAMIALVWSVSRAPAVQGVSNGAEGIIAGGDGAAGTMVPC